MSLAVPSIRKRILRGAWMAVFIPALLLPIPALANASAERSPTRAGASAVDVPADLRPVMEQAMKRDFGNSPTATDHYEDQKITASDGARMHAFGNAVALSGDIAMVGATDVRPGVNFAAVYVFTRANGVWTEGQILHAADGYVGDKSNFGASIDIDGDTAVIGAVGANVGGRAAQGAAYVFKRQQDGTWLQQAKLVASDGQANNWFGEAVAVSGNIALISGYGNTVDGVFQQGAAYLYTETDGVWTQTQKLVSADGTTNDQFGVVLAISDTSLLIGARIAGSNYPGALYVFKKSDGLWQQTQKFSGTSGQSFARSVSAEGKRAVVGAINTYNQGNAYVFDEVNGTWVQTAELRPGTTDTSLNFGYDVAISGTAILVGANRVNVNGAILAGAGYLFTETGGQWTLAQKFMASDAAREDSLGETVALQGNTAVVASPRINVEGELLRGAGYFYTAQSGIRPASASVTPSALSLTTDSGGTDSKVLTIANLGESELSYSITEGASAAGRPAAAASLANPPAAVAAAGVQLRAAGAGSAANAHRAETPLLGSTSFSQMTDNTPGATGASCGTAGVKTVANSWWRRFYFNEHAQVGAAANITSVTVSSGTIETVSGGPASMPVTINLYTIAHSTAVDTLPLGGLTLIGSGSGVLVNGLVSTTVPVLGTVNDTVGKDLVVEYHIAGNATGGQFFPGANATTETHPTFFSAPECGFTLPTKAADLNFPNFHLTMIVNTGPLTSCQMPTDIPWLSATPASGTVNGGEQANVTVGANASGMAPGVYTANICVATNDVHNQLVPVPVSFTVTGKSDPVATVTPSSLAFTVAADATATKSLSIVNAAGSNVLTWSGTAHGPAPVSLQAPARVAGATASPAAAMKGVRFTRTATSARTPIAAPHGTGESLLFQLDDGVYEGALSISDEDVQNVAVWINRFAPPAGTGAYTIDSVSIAWPDEDTANGVLVGKAVNIVAYYDADSDGDASNAVRLGSDTPVSIGAIDTFETYATDFSVPGDGDVYIGFVDSYAGNGAMEPAISAAALDVDGEPTSGYLSANSAGDADITTLSNNEMTTSVFDLSDGYIPGVWMVRATGSTGNACGGPVIDWLTVVPSSGSVNGGESANVSVKVAPYVANLQAGTHNVTLCLATNDPRRPKIAIPVEVTVTAAQAAAPSVVKAFAPTSVVAGTSSTLTITLSNEWPIAARLDSALIDTFPAGLVVASTPAASTTCTGGSVGATAGAGSVTLAAGAKIPANGSCTVKVNVTSATADSYLNTIAAGALQTDRGNSAQAANATLVVTPIVVGPIAAITPNALSLTVQAGASGSSPLTIGNIGDRDLSYSIAESAANANPPSYKNSAAGKYLETGLNANATFAQGSSLGRFGAPVLLSEMMIAQMTDNTPGDQGVSCGVENVSTADNSWWRRFYFNEHPQVGARADIRSVTVSSGTNGPHGMPITINLYTIPHGTPVDTIPTSALTLIGTANATIDSGLVAVTVPVTGTVDDTVGKDLVVEYHTDGFDGGQFFPGANSSSETHPSFISSNICGLTQPTRGNAMGFPNFHLVMVVGIDDGTPPECENPSNVSWLNPTPTSGNVAPGANAQVSVSADAGNLAAGGYTANLCVTTNDPLQRVVAVPVNLTVTPGPITDRIFCDGFDGSACAAGGSSVDDDIVASGPLHLVVPETSEGLYLDLARNLSSPTLIAGFDVNPYQGGGELLFYWAGDRINANGGVAVDESGAHRVLRVGDTVGPHSVFSAAANGASKETAGFLAGGEGYLGVKFIDEATGKTHYGYVHLLTSAPSGFPAVILGYAYNKAGGAITIR